METYHQTLSMEREPSCESHCRRKLAVEMGVTAVSAVEVRTTKLTKEQEVLMQEMPDSAYFQQHLRYQFGIDELPDDRA